MKILVRIANYFSYCRQLETDLNQEHKEAIAKVKDDEIENLHTENSNLRNRLNSLQDEYQNRLEQIQNEKNVEIQHFKDQCDSLQRSINYYTQENTNLKHENTRLQSENSRLRSFLRQKGYDPDNLPDLSPPPSTYHPSSHFHASGSSSSALPSFAPVFISPIPQYIPLVRNTSFAYLTQLYLANELENTNSFFSVKLTNLVEVEHSTNIHYQGKYFEINHAKLPYDIIAQLDNGFEYFITVKSTDKMIENDSEFPIDFNSLRLEPNSEDEKESAIAIFWDANNPSLEKSLIYGNSSLNKILKP